MRIAHNKQADDALSVVHILEEDIEQKDEEVIEHIPHAERPFICKICSKTFKDLTNAKTHQLSHSDYRPFVCEEKTCKAEFKTKGALVRHWRRHTGAKPYVCDKCSMTFRESGALARHRRSKTPCYKKIRKGIINEECVVVINESDLKGSSEKIVDSPTDGVTISTEDSDVTVVTYEVDSLKEENSKVVTGDLHKDDIDSALNQNCKVCGENLSQIDDPCTHLKTHLLRIPFQCPNCSYSAKEEEDIRNHLHLTHSIDTGECKNIENLLKSKSCGIGVDLPNDENSSEYDSIVSNASKSLIQLLAYKTSTWAGCKIDEYSKYLKNFLLGLMNCPVCDKPFKQNAYLKVHLRTHTGERPVECKECGKSFASKDTLAKHAYVHSKHRRFRCGVCGKQFKRYAHVVSHLKTHTDEKLIFCKVCRKCFRTTSALKVHLRTHTDSYAYNCPYENCSHKSREKGAMLRHIRTHTKERPYSCSKCGKTFAEQTSLSRHLKSKGACSQIQKLIIECTEMEADGQEIMETCAEEEISYVYIPVSIIKETIKN
ncbi:DgyrCDS11935 [Dimorphilus gyrociliatus]|uniref:DgyrCDS11935 n=1 Tax=Dimorphilus gyrociliatus TaxID=2664684 RepID=A0A7I8W4Y6_9ANNE|nr:DgyrCDS11935 [Dimorphilus gyrociliatus]